MKIALRLCREAEIEDSFDSGDVDSSSHKISGQEIINFTALKLFNVLETLFLRQVAMNFCGFEAEKCKEGMQACTLFLLIKEDNDTLFECL